jgi:hypothetical protein
MRNARRISRVVGLIVIALSHPSSGPAGHGIEDTIDTLTAERVKQLLDAGEKMTFIDMRPAKEYQQNRLPGARSLPIAEVPNRCSEIPKTGRVVLYCDCKTYERAPKSNEGPSGWQSGHGFDALCYGAGPGWRSSSSLSALWRCAACGRFTSQTRRSDSPAHQRPYRGRPFLVDQPWGANTAMPGF